MTEAQIQRALVEHLHLRCTTPCWFAVPNGGQRNIITAANLKRQGVRAGVPDLIFLKNRVAYALELKTDRGRISVAQEDFIDDWGYEGGVWAIAYGLDHAITVLKAWRLLK